jgi:hypothetical protein
MLEVLISYETSVLKRATRRTSQKTQFFIVTVVKTWNLTKAQCFDNWICFYLQVRNDRYLLRSVDERETVNLSCWIRLIGCAQCWYVIGTPPTSGAIHQTTLADCNHASGGRYVPFVTTGISRWWYRLQTSYSGMFAILKLTVSFACIM